MVVGYVEAAPTLLDSPPLSPAALALICSCLLLVLAHNTSTCSSHRFGDLDLFSSVGASLAPPLL